jgi:chromate reductase
MTTNRTIAIIAGSNRRDSINRKLAAALGALLPGSVRVTFPRIDDLPLYNQDLEAPPPPAVARFKTELAEADGVIVVTPEHNRSIPAVLKNAVDWAARPYGHNSWNDKPVFITGASPGAIATAVAQQHLRHILGILGALVLGGEAYITFKSGLIDADGRVADDSVRGFLQGHLERFLALVWRVTDEQRSAA